MISLNEIKHIAKLLEDINRPQGHGHVLYSALQDALRYMAPSSENSKSGPISEMSLAREGLRT